MTKAVILCLAYILVAFSHAEDMTLNTRLGSVTGVTDRESGSQVYRFLGIPYAKPPVGASRFTKPEAHGPYSAGGLDARNFGSFCPQLDETLQVIGDEDCLFLNIYTPSVPSNDTAEHRPLSVMVWTHGGTFVNGASNDFNADILASTQRVIVVTFNYRLAALGFLAKSGTGISGNYGLFDQQLVLQWVKDNIADFGGCPDSITLFGQSSGAFMVTYQLMTPLNDATLFQRGITQSGSAVSFNTLNYDPNPTANAVLQSLGCPADDPLPCLRSKSFSELISVTDANGQSLTYSPAVDDDFIPSYLLEQLADFIANGFSTEKTFSLGNLAEYDIMSGWNDQDGLLFTSVAQLVNFALTGTGLDEGISELVLKQSLLAVAGSGTTNVLLSSVIDTLVNFYLNDPFRVDTSGQSDNMRRLEAFVNISGDVVFQAPTIHHLQLHSLISNKNAYSYEFSHFRRIQGRLFEGPEGLRTGSNHEDEIAYVFGYPWLPEQKCREILNVPTCQFTRQEKLLAKKIMKTWAGFAKTGSPPPQSNFEKFRYPQDQSYTQLRTGNFKKLNYPLVDNARLIAALDYASALAN